MKYLNYTLLRSIFALLIGFFLVRWPEAAVDYIVIVVGLAFFIPGLISLLVLLFQKGKVEVVKRHVIEAVGSLLFGLWLVLMPGFFADMLLFLLGFIIILGGISQLSALTVAREWRKVPAVFYLSPALILILGIVTVFNPTGVRNTAFVLMGVLSIFYGITDIVTWFKFMRYRPTSYTEIEDSDE